MVIDEAILGFLRACRDFLRPLDLRIHGGKTYGDREGFLTEEIYPFAWVPFVGGISSGLSSIGTAETVFPLLERVYKMNIHRAIATTVVVEGLAGWWQHP